MKTLIVITGPTGVGKTAAAIELAEALHCDIVGADSRQVYHGIPIGTAAPTAEEMARVRHHLVSFLPLEAGYNAWQYEHDALEVLEGLWHEGDYAVLCGGSMMYVDAVCHGIDPMPSISDEVRETVLAELNERGLESLLEELRERDPEYYVQVDRQNTRRVVHAVEVCRQAGVPYSSLRTGTSAPRDFKIVKAALNLPREELFDRINRRVDAMIGAGLEEEARAHNDQRHLNALNTVGYKEMFAYFDGVMDWNTAVARIKKNTRVYAKKQLTWLRRDPDVQWLAPHEWQRLLP